MNELSDYAMGDQLKYCKHCCREDGSMQSYDEKLLALTAFIASQGIDQDIAHSIAIAAMTKLPAWKERHRT